MFFTASGVMAVLKPRAPRRVSTAQTVTAGSAPSNSATLDAVTNRITTPGNNYDDSGNLTASGSGTSFGYNPESFMTSAATSTGSNTSVRDALGRRVKKTVLGVSTDYFYVGAEIIAEKTGSTWTDYIFFGGQRIAKQTGSTITTATFLHTDHLGSVRRCTDSTGAQNGTCDYEPYGEGQSSAGCTVPSNFRFAGMLWDSESNLNHTWFRQYDSAQGRWLSPDPVAGGGNPQGLNRYAYVINNPINGVDPDGRVPIIEDLAPACGHHGGFGTPVFDPGAPGPRWFCNFLPA